MSAFVSNGSILRRIAVPGIPASKNERAAVIMLAALFGVGQHIGEHFNAEECFTDAEDFFKEMRKRGLTVEDMS